MTTATRNCSFTASEVLLLEALHIAKRRGWASYAYGMVNARASQQLKILEYWAGSPVAIPSATSGVLGPDDEPDNDAKDRRPLRERMTECVEAASAGERAAKAPHSSIDQTMEFARGLLADFSNNLTKLPEQLREAIDRDLEDSHRRFVLTGQEQPHRHLEVDASPGGTDDDGMHPHALSGLALSGGGVRSATFALGAIQAMSRFALLRVFDYVSAVSGGGWAAGWLAAWAHRHERGIHGVEDEIFKSRPADSVPMRWVRRHIAYLAPRPGLTSGDTWALLVAYVSNWLPIVALASLSLLAMLILPHALSSSARAISSLTEQSTQLIFVACTGLLLLAFMTLIRRLTLYYREPGERVRRTPLLFPLVAGGALMSTILLTMTMPVIAHLTIELAESPTGRSMAFHGATLVGAAWFSMSASAAIGAWALSTATGQRIIDLCRPMLRQPRIKSGRLLRHQAPRTLEFFAQAMSALLVTILITLLLPLADSAVRSPGYRLAFGPIILIGVFAISELFGLMLTYRRDVDMAWIARMGGWVLSALTVWTLLCLFALGSTSLWRDPALANLGIGVAIALACVVFCCAWLFARAGRERRSQFGLLAFVVLLAPLLPLAASFMTRTEVGELLDLPKLWMNLLFVVVPLFILLLMCNVNRYSLHAIYRQGLVRTFLGASRLALRNSLGAASTSPELNASSIGAGVSSDSRPKGKAEIERRAAPATNIDEDDDPSLSDLNREIPGRELPVLLFNAAVNGISRSDLEGRAPRQWPFTFSQIFTGSPATGIGYATTESFYSSSLEKRLTLGAAMAVSGAAVSPTSGTSTHPLRAFLMGVLNARLGMWIGNPSNPEAVKRASPRLGGFTVLQEMLGLRARFGDWIHLSDGGHFENLGVYELIRRGCLRIIAVDASCDPDRHFEDLADAVRRARIDLGVQIHPRDHWCIQAPSGNAESDARAWMWFEIDYGANLPSGRILYIKPSVYDHDKKLQAEVFNYWRQSKQFPHESTMNQFFSERQMEAYRGLGESCTVAAIASAVGQDGGSDESEDGRDPGFARLLLRSAMGRRPSVASP